MVSSFSNDFNFDRHVSFTAAEMAKGNVRYNYDMQKGNDELPGTSVFYKDESGDVFHTYSSYARGGDLLLDTYNYLDLAPKGRNGTGPHHDQTDRLGTASRRVRPRRKKISQRVYLLRGPEEILTISSY